MATRQQREGLVQLPDHDGVVAVLDEALVAATHIGDIRLVRKTGGTVQASPARTVFETGAVDCLRLFRLSRPPGVSP